MGAMGWRKHGLVFAAALGLVGTRCAEPPSSGPPGSAGRPDGASGESGESGSGGKGGSAGKSGSGGKGQAGDGGSDARGGRGGASGGAAGDGKGGSSGSGGVEPGGNSGQGGQAEGGHGGAGDDCGRVLDLTGLTLEIRTPEELEQLAGVSLFRGYLLELHDVIDPSPLRCLERVEGDLELHDWGQQDLSGLSTLASVTGDFHIEGGALVTLNGLTSFDEMGTGFLVRNATALRTIGSLGNVTETDGFLRFVNCTSLENLHGLEPLTRVGNFGLSNNGGIDDLSGLESLTEAKGIALRDEQLIDIRALSGITSLTGSLELINSGLTDLEGLHNITRVAGAQGVYLDGDFTTLNGLRSLTVIDHRWWGRLSALPDFDSFGHAVAVGGDLNLMGSFTDLDGLAGTTAGGFLLIGYSPNLTSLAGLSSVTAVTGLQIVANPSLTNLEGLHNIATVTGHVMVNAYCYDQQGTLVCEQNDSLTNLRGLRGLTSIGGGLFVERNPVLPGCEAVWLRDHVGTANIGGPISLLNNFGSGACPP
jgi:hypothetical protein